MTHDSEDKSQRDLREEAKGLEWQDPVTSAETISSLAEQYGMSSLNTWKIVDQQLREQIGATMMFKRTWKDYLAAVVLIIFVALTPVAEWYGDPRDVGVFLVEVLFAPVAAVMIGFLLLADPKHTKWLTSVVRWWAGVLAAVVTIVVPFWLQTAIDGKESEKLRTVVTALLASLFMLALVLGLSVLISHIYNASVRSREHFEQERVILNFALPLLHYCENGSSLSSTMGSAKAPTADMRARADPTASSVPRAATLALSFVAGALIARR